MYQSAQPKRIHADYQDRCVWTLHGGAEKNTLLAELHQRLMAKGPIRRSSRTNRTNFITTRHNEENVVTDLFIHLTSVIALSLFPTTAQQKANNWITTTANTFFFVFLLRLCRMQL